VTRDEVAELLRWVRSLVEQKFGEQDVDPWMSVVGDLELSACLAAASRLAGQGHNRIYAGHIRAHVTGGREPRRIAHCELCSGTGWVEGPRVPAGRFVTAAQARPNHPEGSPISTSQSVPCRCTEGKRSRDLANRLWPTARHADDLDGAA
jgi:hypothetical protein